MDYLCQRFEICKRFEKRVMIRIESHIEKLLLSHDCVIVPGIGGFITRNESSFIEGSEIYPPYRSISFNSQLKDNDGLLVQSYMAAYDTSYPRAQSLVEENVKEINHTLHEKGEYEFRHIGKLQLTQNQALVFSPFDSMGVSSMDHYGLMPCAIGASASSVAVVQEETAESIDHRLDAANRLNSMSEESAGDCLAESPESSHYVVRISKRSVRYAVASMAAALLYFVFTIAPSANPVCTNVQEAAIVSTTRTSATCGKATPAASGHRPAIQKEMPKQKTDSVHRDEAVISGHADSFTIVVASAISRKGGEKLVENLKKENLDCAQFVHDGKMSRVIYASFPSRKDACEALGKLRASNDRFSSAWVMKR